MYTLEGVHAARHGNDDRCFVYLTFVDENGMPTNRSTCGTYTPQGARNVGLDIAEMVGRTFRAIPPGIEHERFSRALWAALAAELAE